MTKKRYINEELDENDEDIVLETLRNAEMLVARWMEYGYIKGVIDMYDNNNTSDITNCNCWISELKVTSTRKINVKLYFTINTNYQLRDLRDREIDYLKQE